MPERQGAGEGATGGLQVTPVHPCGCQGLLIALLQACQLPATPEFGSQHSSLIRYSQLTP